MKDPRIKEKVLEILTKQVHKEMTVMCSRNTGSVLRSTAPDVLKRFTWVTVVAEVQAHAPTLLQMMKGITDVKRRVLSSKKSKTTHKSGEKGPQLKLRRSI